MHIHSSSSNADGPTDERSLTQFKLYHVFGITAKIKTQSKRLSPIIFPFLLSRCSHLTSRLTSYNLMPYALYPSTLPCCNLIVLYLAIISGFQSLLKIISSWHVCNRLKRFNLGSTLILSSPIFVIYFEWVASVLQIQSIPGLSKGAVRSKVPSLNK
jgi:hypothetical protein